MVCAEVLRRLLRQHPKLHPGSASAAEFGTLGLGHLPFLDVDEDQPWGCFVDSPEGRLSPLSVGLVSPKAPAEALGSTAELLLAEASPRQDPAQVVASLKQRMGSDMVVCFLAPPTLCSPDSEALVAALARHLSDALPPPIALVGNGGGGAQSTFAKNCKVESRLWNLLLFGQTAESAGGNNVHCCHDVEDQRVIMARLGDVYVTVEGGPEITQIAALALEQGAFVFPLQRSGGASGGSFSFPAAALRRPEWIHEDDWGLTCEVYASVEASAAAVARIVAAYCSVSVAPQLPVESVALTYLSDVAVSDPPPAPRPPAKPRATKQPAQRSRNVRAGIAVTARDAVAGQDDDGLAALEAEEAALMHEVRSLDRREEQLLSRGVGDAAVVFHRPAAKASPQLRGGVGVSPGRPPRPPT